MTEIRQYDYDQFYAELRDAWLMSEWTFYFSDDPFRKQYLIICHRMRIMPYTIQKLPSGKVFSFNTAEELLTAKLFRGKTIKDKWNQIVFAETE